MIQRHYPSSHRVRFPHFRPLLAASLLLAALLILPLAGRAQLIGSLTEGAASSPYSYNLTVQFSNGHYYDFTLNSSTASYTGTDFINTVAADSQGTPFVLTVGQVASSFGNYINAITVNSDTNSGFVNNSYWSYWNSSTSAPTAWTYSEVGEDSRTIAPEQADGWVYGDGTTAPSAVTIPAPEPSAWALAILGMSAGGAWAVRRRGRIPAAR